MKHTSFLLPSINAAQLQRLLQASKTISSQLQLPEVLREVINIAAELTDSRAASILLKNGETGELEFVATSNEQSLVGVRVPMEGSFAGEVMQKNQPMVTQAPSYSRQHSDPVYSRTGWLPSSILGVPLRHRGEILGALEVLDKHDGQEYTPQDEAVAQALASQASVAISNARLFQQTDAIAEIMHELKTPLVSLMAAVELLDRDELEDDQHDQIVGVMRSELKRVTKMTQDFLELSRLDSGRVLMEKDEVDIAELVTGVVEAQLPQAERAGLEIGVFLPEDKPLPQPVGDVYRLKQVLFNLVSNAIKYNRPGGRIAVRARQEGEFIRISVADTGPGISPEHLPHLFERFYRISTTALHSEGSGLGLPIAKKILEAHGGRIEVESEIDKGSIFHCFLPVN